MHTRLILSALMFFAISGCVTAGKDYVRPDTAAPGEWHSEESAHITYREDVRLEKWWNVFQDKTLTELIEMTRERNKNLESAGYALSAARAKISATRAGQLPSVEASTSATGTYYGDDSMSDQTLDSYSAGLDASWEIDLFGGLKRETEAVTADMQATEESLNDALVTLTAETATAYINLRTLQNSLKTAEKSAIINAELYDLAKMSYEAGIAEKLSVKQAEYSLQSSVADIYDIKKSISETLNSLTLLTGQKPGALDELLKGYGEVPSAPESIAVSIPADVIRNRPDIRSAERKLAAQSARTGVAQTDLYPRLTLGGSIGYQSENTGSLLDSDSFTASIGPSLRWAVFDFGAIRRNIEVQTELQKQYMADYESAVLSAYEDVENALNAYDTAHRKNSLLSSAAQAALEAFELEYSKYESGLGDFSDVLSAESTYITYQNKYTQNKGDIAVYLAALYKALGGGWEKDGTADEK